MARLRISETPMRCQARCQCFHEIIHDRRQFRCHHSNSGLLIWDEPRGRAATIEKSESMIRNTSHSSSTVGDAKFPQLVDSTRGDAFHSEILVSRIIHN